MTHLPCRLLCFYICAMFEKRFFVEGLAHASYLIGDAGEAAVIDPKRDVDDYIETAEREKLKIVAIFETHPHADFVSGHLELAQRTGATVYVSHHAPATYQRVPARDGQTVRVGSLQIRCLETPGHSPDSMSFVVESAGKPACVFTGDTLFVGDVGGLICAMRKKNPIVSPRRSTIRCSISCWRCRTKPKCFPRTVAGHCAAARFRPRPSQPLAGTPFNWALPRS